MSLQQQIEALHKYSSDIYYSPINQCLKYGIDSERCQLSLKNQQTGQYIDQQEINNIIINMLEAFNNSKIYKTSWDNSIPLYREIDKDIFEEVENDILMVKILLLLLN